MTKLTPQILAMYLGCEAQTPYRTESEEGKPMNRLTGKMYEVCSLTEQCDVILSNGVQVTYLIDEIKPILRRLSDMTEEEQSEYDRLQVTCYSTYKFIDQVLTDAKTINYLRSIGIDCDNLIDTNQAIEKQ